MLRYWSKQGCCHSIVCKFYEFIFQLQEIWVELENLCLVKSNPVLSSNSVPTTYLGTLQVNFCATVYLSIKRELYMCFVNYLGENSEVLFKQVERYLDIKTQILSSV